MDTAQPVPAAETVTIAEAANAFKAFTSDEPISPSRDDLGRFASTAEPEEELDEAELAEAEVEDEPEAADEPAQPMPPSWGNDDAELWETLPPEAQAKIAAREGERDRAVGQKFQEAANARKEAQAEREAVANSRRELAEQLHVVTALYESPQPDPRAFGAGTGQYNREAYDYAMAQWQENSQLVQAARQRLQEINHQHVTEATEAFKAEKAAIDAEFAPKFIEEAGLNDPAKSAEVERGLYEFAVSNGIPETVFTDPSEREGLTSAQLRILWMAMQYQSLATKAPAPKPKQPVVRPGVSSPRSAQKAASRQRDYERLSREGSIEAGAAVFKHLFK
jgi:hypothetical protein